MVSLNDLIMKAYTPLIILAFIALLFACNEQQNQKKRGPLFTAIADFPIIKDSTQFITKLKQSFDLVVEESNYQKKYERISVYQKVKLYGSDEDFILIEYDYGSGSNASFPHKYQIILTTAGQLIKILSAYRFEFVEIFKEEPPFLLTLVITARGNGGHHLYQITADSLENVYEGYYDFAIRTYDAHTDNQIYEPNELIFKVEDFDQDGFNDIAFLGQIVLIQGKTKDGFWFDYEIINGKTIDYSVENPFKKIPIEYIFLYNEETGHFKAKRDYEGKYET